MKIAMLISGRAVRYEVCLLPFLETIQDHEIHLFMSINDEDSDYYEVMRMKLEPWLKADYVKPFVFPKPFHYTSTKRWGHQLIDGEWLPYNILSMYWNDTNAFKLATDYADRNGFEYDYYMKFRSDICVDSMPKLVEPLKDATNLYFVRHTMDIPYEGLYRDTIQDVVSDAWAWGSRKPMSQYCKTYDYVLQKLEEKNGDYYIMFEHSLSDNIYEHRIQTKIIEHSYLLDRNRRIFDKAWRPNSEGVIMDNRIECWSKTWHTLDSKTVLTTEHIPVIPYNVL